jgi:hypothetical protein
MDMPNDIYAVITDEGVEVTRADVPHVILYTPETDGYQYWWSQAVAQAG